MEKKAKLSLQENFKAIRQLLMTRTNFTKDEFVPSEEFENTVGTIFRTLHPFSKEDIKILASFHRELQLVKNKNQKLQAGRLELLLILQKQNQKRIFNEKQKLIAQLNSLHALAGSSPLGVSADYIYILPVHYG